MSSVFIHAHCKDTKERACGWYWLSLHWHVRMPLTKYHNVQKTAIANYHSDRHLTVNCGHVSPEVDEKQLSHQLDSMSSADHFVEHFTSLIINYTPLTRVPALVCKLFNLTLLNLNHNKLTELPDNCFTKLTKLETLSAENNAIVGLHDGLFDGLLSLVNLYLRSNHRTLGILQLFGSDQLTFNLFG